MSNRGNSNSMPLAMNNIIRNDVVMDSFKKFNFSTFVMVMIVIYFSPSDYEDKYIARVWTFDPILRRHVPTKFMMIKDTLDEVRQELPPILTKIDRFDNDDKCIVEVYL